MAKNKRKDIRKQPKIAEEVAGSRMVRASETGSTEGENPHWILSTFDYHGPWGVAACKDADCATHLANHLRGFETMTWAEIAKASGGRHQGTNNHYIKVEDLSKAARDRLEKIERDDLESVYSLRLQAAVRLYGIRAGKQFQFLWFDPWHNDESRAVCPSPKRNK